MSEIDRLNREVKNLNAQVKNLKDQLNRQYQTMQADMRRQMQDYEKKLQQKAEVQSRQMQDQYNRELASMRWKLERQLSQEEKVMTDKYLSLLDDLENTKEDAARREAELEQLVKEYTESRKQKDEQTEQQAKAYLQEMEDVMEQVQKQPCEAFFPGKMETYRGTFRNAWNLMKNGLAQAAAAVAVSVRSALERFSIDIDSSQKAWEKEFEEICMYCSMLQTILKDWEDNWIEEEGTGSGNASTACAEADINYWTKGWYLPVKRWLQERLERNKQIRDTGISEYLKQDGAISMEELREEGKIFQQYLAQCPAYQAVYQDTYQNAVERMEWSEKISKFMVVEKCYRYRREEDEMQQADSCLCGKEYFQHYNRLILEDEESTDDYQGWYMMQFHGDNKLRVEICILPVADMGRLKNVIQFHIHQGENNVSIKELLASIKAAVQSALPGAGVRILNTNDEKEKEQLQAHAMGRQVVKEVEKMAERRTYI